jgi:TolA-binding protein
VDEIIEQVRKEEEEARLAEQQAMQDMAFNQSMLYNNNQTNMGGNQTGGQWYFYNLNAKSFGQPEFRMKWGIRTLEDNWRRKNKQSISSQSGGEGAEGDTINGGNGQVIFDNKSREYYLMNVPLTDSAMEQSHFRLENALYNMGVIYKDNLLDYEESIEAFEELLSRYPNGQYPAPAMYSLHDLNNNVQNPSRAEYYKAQLLAKYPESHYSKLLNNPNYIQELEEEEQQVVRLYEQVFMKYRQEDYGGVIADSDRAIEEFAGDPLEPKFKYIRALSVGAIGGKEEMKIELDSLIAQHPATAESTQAQEIIDFMYVEFPEIKEAAQAQEAEEIYTEFDPAQEHHFLLALQSSEDVNQVSFDLLNYNLDHFNQYDLSIEQIQMTDSYHLLVVKTFTNEDAARRYLQVIGENSDQILEGISSSLYHLMIISADNFVTLADKKVQNPYYLFYRKHYLNQE